MDAREVRMDSEFDQHIIDMKPYVLRLQHKTERQRCALWIKKLCEPPLSTADRNNRNLHAKLLLHMLKRGLLDGPFAVRPEDGQLKTLPSYMSIFFNEPSSTSDHMHLTEEMYQENSKFAATETPDWVRLELDGSLPVLSGSKENIDPQSDYRTSSPRQHSLRLSRSDVPSFNGRGRVSPINRPWEQPTNEAFKGPSTFRDEQSLIRMHEKELEMKSKVLQAQFHEDKLKLQHKHDIAVQKILDRKNSEIEELKQHYRNKDKDHEESTIKADRRAQSLVKELQMLRETKDKQIDELKLMLDETTEAAKAEYEAKVQEALGGFERDKYELQKTHTKNIQQLLDDTNQRLMKMEDEYNAQTTATKMVTSELECRVSQLTQETESLSMAKQSLMNDKEHAERLLENAEKKIRQLEEKYSNLEKEFKLENENHDLQMKSLMNKFDANSEFLKQESNLSLNKAQETARELEDQIQSLKHGLQDSEQQRMRELRDRESLHQQDMMSVQHLHEKQLHQLRTEWDQEKSHHAREIRNMEDIVRERDEQIARLTVQQKQNSHHAEQAIEQYKKQMSDAQKKVYSDMQAQLDKISDELDNNKKYQERMKDDHKIQMEELKAKYQDELTDMKMKCEQDKVKVTQHAISDRDQLSKTYDKQLEDAERRLRDALEEHERVAEERKLQHHEVITGMEAQIRELREELVSATALRRQQLVELGLLREEERQKAAREHDAIVNRLESEMDRQRMEMHRQNASELDRQAQKTKNRLEGLEKDYKQRLERAYDRISELQEKENSLRDELSRVQVESEQHIADDAAKREEEAKRLRLQLESANIALLAELEAEREKFHSIQRQSQNSEFDLKDKLTRVKMDYEERMKGLLPASLRKDMEDTITCLRSQVSSLQQRVSILQDEVDEGNRLIPFSLKTPSTISPRHLS
ncbi:centrosomal protein of 112 kDa-like isoform X1 [Styela clava]